MKHLVVLCAALLFVGCSSSEKNRSKTIDETRVTPAVAKIVNGKLGNNEWKYSNDCKTWIDADTFTKKMGEAKPQPRYAYEQLTTADPGMATTPRLLQYDSKDRVLIGDNMTMLHLFSEFVPPKDKSHNPIVNTKKEFVDRYFHNSAEQFVIGSSRMTSDELDSSLGWMRDSRKASWSVRANNPDGAILLSFAFSGVEADRNDPKHLSSRYLLLHCSKESCKLVKTTSSKPNEPFHRDSVVLTKTSLELSELRDLPGFNWNMISEVDQMCAVNNRAQMVKLLVAHRDEYAKNCKVILSDDAIVRKWGELCRSYKEQVRPVASALF